MIPSSPAPVSPARRRRRMTREQRERQRPLWCLFADADKRLDEEHGLSEAHPMRACTRLLARSAAAYEIRATAIDTVAIESATQALPGGVL